MPFLMPNTNKQFKITESIYQDDKQQKSTEKLSVMTT